MTTNFFFRERMIFILSMTLVAFLVGLILGRTSVLRDKQELEMKVASQTSVLRKCIEITKKAKESESTVEASAPEE